MKLNNIIENIIVVLHILHIRMNNKTKNRGDPLFFMYLCSSWTKGVNDRPPP